MKNLLYFLFFITIFTPVAAQAQLKVDKKNLSKAQYEYWDKNKTRVKAVGSYYKDNVNKTSKKHGTWRYFSKDGIL